MPNSQSQQPIHTETATVNIDMYVIDTELCHMSEMLMKIVALN